MPPTCFQYRNARGRKQGEPLKSCLVLGIVGDDGIHSRDILSLCRSGRRRPDRKAGRAVIERHHAPALFLRGGGQMSKAFRGGKDYTEYVDADVLLVEFQMELYRRQCDTLDENGKPQRSPDRSRCHPRDSDDQWRVPDNMTKIVACPREAIEESSGQGFPEI